MISVFTRSSGTRERGAARASPIGIGCMQGDGTLLAKRGWLPTHSYVNLPRAQLLRVGERVTETFDEGHYWRGLDNILPP